MEDYGIFEGLFSEIAAPLINGTLGKMAQGAKGAWGKVEDHRAAKAYKAKLQKRYGTIQILGQPEPQKLGKVYTDVYLHDRPTHSYAMGIEQLEESFQKRGRFGQEERIDGLEFAKRQDRVFILGKTTFMKYLAIQAAEGDIPKIPIFVSLNDLANKKLSILEYMAQQFDVCNFPGAETFIEQLLQKGNGLILFDGLDEVQKENKGRIKLTQDLKDFIDKYDQNRFAITCRIAASDYNFQGFNYVEMADFTDEQVEKFVQGWFAENKLKLDGFLGELKKDVNKGMKDMTSSPLLLTLLCIQYDGSMAFHPFRSEIYEKALTVLLETWDTHRSIGRDDLVIENEDNYRALTTKRKMQLMSRLAHHSFIKGDLFLKQSWLERKVAEYLGKMPNLPDEELIDGKVVLKGMESQHGLVVERASQIFSFSHLTLQEYFTAKYIASHKEVELPKLLTLERLSDTRWREVFLFVAELLEEGDELVTAMAALLQNMAESKELRTLIEWVEKRRLKRVFSCRPLSSRLSYISRLFVHNSGIKPMLQKRESSFTLMVFTIPDGAVLSNFNFDLAVANLRQRALLRDSYSILDHKFTLAHDLFRASDYDNYFDALQFAIQESQRLKWNDLTIALERIPKPSTHLIDRDRNNIVSKAFKQIEQEILLDNWKWEFTNNESLNYVTIWLKGHELLFECLDRAVLEDLDREKFKDEMLYCLPKGEPIQMMDID